MKKLILLTLILFCSDTIALHISSYGQDYVIYIDESRSYVVMPEDLNAILICEINHEHTFYTMDGDTISQFSAIMTNNTEHKAHIIFQISYRTNIISLGEQYIDFNSKTTQVGNEKHFRGKKPRTRTRFTLDQLAMLEQKFQHKQYLTTEEKKAVSHKVGIKDSKIVTIWFQNRRQKLRKQQKTMEPTSTVTKQEDTFFLGE